MKTSLSSSVLELTAEQVGRLTDDELSTLNRLLEDERAHQLDARCAIAEVDERGWASASDGPLYWLQNLTKAIDDHALAKGTPAKAPFPRKTYFRPLIAELLKPVLNLSPDCYTTLFPKAREMMTSWAICGYIGWLCQWRPGTLGVAQTLKETKAEELIRYVAILTENQEP